MVQLTFRRTEIKYVLSDEQCHSLLAAMEGRMVADEWGASTVCSVYYDTPTDLLARRSLNHPLYKEKVRARSYGPRRPGSTVFVELKKKFDGVVYKRRAAMGEEAARALLAGHGRPATQIERELDSTVRRYGGLLPRAFIAYDREAFYAADDRDFRMTFDRRARCRWTDLTLTSSSEGQLLLPGGETILEVKGSRAMPLWLARWLSSERLFKASFSKYGAAYQMRLAQHPELGSAARPQAWPASASMAGLATASAAESASATSAAGPSAPAPSVPGAPSRSAAAAVA